LQEQLLQVHATVGLLHLNSKQIVKVTMCLENGQTTS